MKANTFNKVIQNTIFMLNTYSFKETLQKQAESREIIQNLKLIPFQELKVESALEHTKGIGIRNIFEMEKIRITLYYLPVGEVMKLHNHPSMLVISYVVQGKVQIKNYSQTSKKMIFLRQIRELTKDSFSYIDGMKETKNNLHELRAIESTFFVDILFPDYDSTRECLFFEEAEEVSNNMVRLKQIEPEQIEFFQM